MNIVESWKKQITFLYSKDLRIIALCALKRYANTLLTLVGCCLFVILFFVVYLFFRYYDHNIVRLLRGCIVLATFLFVLFLRPSVYKKDYTYLWFVSKKQAFSLCTLSFLISLLPLMLFILCLFIGSLLLLLRLDGAYRIKNVYILIKKTGIFFLYNFPTVMTLGITVFCTLKFLNYFFIYNRIIDAIICSFIFSSILILSVMVLTLVYTVSVYEHDQLYFE